MTRNRSSLFDLLLAFAGVGLFVSSSAQESRHVFHKSAAAEIFQRGPMTSEFVLTTEQTEGRYSIVKEIFEPGMSSYPGHTHKSHSELFFIVSGVMEWTVAGRTSRR